MSFNRSSHSKREAQLWWPIVLRTTYGIATDLLRAYLQSALHPC